MFHSMKHIQLQGCCESFFQLERLLFLERNLCILPWICFQFDYQGMSHYSYVSSQRIKSYINAVPHPALHINNRISRTRVQKGAWVQSAALTAPTRPTPPYDGRTHTTARRETQPLHGSPARQRTTPIRRRAVTLYPLNRQTTFICRPPIVRPCIPISKSPVPSTASWPV